MAQPAASVVAGHYHAHCSDADSEGYMYVVMKVPKLPSKWHVDNEEDDLFKMGFSFQAQISDETEDLTIGVWLGNESVLTRFEIGVTATTWVKTNSYQVAHHATAYPDKPQYPDGFSMNNENNSEEWEKNKYVVHELDYVVDGTASSEDILMLYGIHLECVDDDASVEEDVTYFAGDGHRYVNTSAAQTNTVLLAADYPCSSYHVQWLLCDNYEIFLNRNKPQFTTPVFGENEY